AYELAPGGGKPRQASVSTAFKAPEPTVPLGQRYRDGASVRALPAIALKQLTPGPDYVASLALRGQGELLYESTSQGTWQLKGGDAELWNIDPENPLARKPPLVRLGEVQKTISSPDPTAASWTLFRISAHRGNGILSDVAYVQCAFTEKGLPP